MIEELEEQLINTTQIVGGHTKYKDENGNMQVRIYKPLINVRRKYWNAGVLSGIFPKPSVDIPNGIRLWRKSVIKHYIETGEIKKSSIRVSE